MQVLNGDCNPSEPRASLILQLEVEDAIVVDYLRSFPPQEREPKALEALHVGVIALRSVAPALDTSIVDRKFRDLERKLEDYASEFARKLGEHLDQYFQPGTGSLPNQLEALVGTNGSLAKTFEDYFGSEQGLVAQLVRDQVGPGSEFGKVVDPENNRGLLQRIEKTIDAKLQESAANVLSQFSLDKSGSALARMQDVMTSQIGQIKSEMSKFFADLKELHGLERGRAEEAEKGTQKGRDFESAVYEQFAQICRTVGDLSENVTASPGNISRCKTGDYLSTLASDSGAAGARIVIEAKKKDGYTLRTALDELKQARENRAASIGVMVFSLECCPVEVGAFRIIDNDILVGLDLEEPERAEFYLESSYRIARAMAVLTRQQERSTRLDGNKVAALISRIEKACDRFAEINKKATSIKQNTTSIEEVAEELRFEIEHQLHEMEVVIQGDERLEA